MAVMSHTYEVACWVTEQPIGFRLTSKAVHQRLPHISMGAISGTLHNLSKNTDIIQLVGRGKRNAYIYEVCSNSIAGLKFNKKPAAYQRHRRNGSKAERRLKPTADLFEDPKVRKQFLRQLDEEELWAELQRRDLFS